LTDKV